VALTKVTSKLNAWGAFIALCIFALSASALWVDRENAWERATQSAHNLLSALQSDTARTINLYDLSIQGALDDLNLPGLNDVNPSIRHGLLFDHAATADYLGSILVLNASGDVVEDSESITPRTGNFADRDYFQVQKARSDVGLYVSLPFKSRRQNGEDSIAISRRITLRDGSFGGVVMGAIRLSYFIDRFRQLTLGQGGTISLFRTDGVMLVRTPHGNDDVGRDLSKTENTQHFKNAESGTFLGISYLDGVRRFYNFTHVNGLPLVISVALSTHEILLPWQRRAMVLVPITLLLCCAIMALTAMSQRELNLRRQIETELATLAQTDGLTGLSNRRAFDQALQREWRAAYRDRLPLTLLFIDADNFKRFNDHYGHQAGDTLLARLAATIASNVQRPRDFVARYGGEEFTALYPGVGPEHAWVLAERIRTSVEALQIENGGIGGAIVTISVGLACITPERSQLSSDLVARADAALYRAKNLGRNRSEVG
jgi:diguanylate cyclase (GGDEF)-like protein